MADLSVKEQLVKEQLPADSTFVVTLSFMIVQCVCHAFTISQESVKISLGEILSYGVIK